MAITIPDKCHRQKNETLGVDSSGGKTFDYILKGPHPALKTLMDSLSVGQNIEGDWFAETWTLSRNPGNLGTLTITCRLGLAGSGEEGSGEGEEKYATVAEDETWTLKSVRNDISILAYCGESGTNPSREDIEAWQKEPDGTLAKELKYTKSDGTIHEIHPESATAALIGKIRKGIDSVMRFYPMLTKTRTFLEMPASIYENLATIDTPSVSPPEKAKRRKKPGNLDKIIAAHTWLKCQDDLAKLPDGKYQQIESWMGCLISEAGDSGWDENLYGKDDKRWQMPLFI